MRLGGEERKKKPPGHFYLHSAQTTPLPVLPYNTTYILRSVPRHDSRASQSHTQLTRSNRVISQYFFYFFFSKANQRNKTRGKRKSASSQRALYHKQLDILFLVQTRRERGSEQRHTHARTHAQIETQWSSETTSLPSSSLCFSCCWPPWHSASGKSCTASGAI